ncbi:Homeobox domain-like [Trinorchestia longiramus]|nr:Homeobox domain-like [Trinorchestia longiramus]
MKLSKVVSPRAIGEGFVPHVDQLQSCVRSSEFHFPATETRDKIHRHKPPEGCVRWVKIWFQNRRTKWKKVEGVTNAEAAELKNSTSAKNRKSVTASSASSPHSLAALPGKLADVAANRTVSEASSPPGSPSQASPGCGSDASSGDETSSSLGGPSDGRKATSFMSVPDHLSHPNSVPTLPTKPLNNNNNVAFTATPDHRFDSDPSSTTRVCNQTKDAVNAMADVSKHAPYDANVHRSINQETLQIKDEFNLKQRMEANYGSVPLEQTHFKNVLHLTVTSQASDFSDAKSVSMRDGFGADKPLQSSESSSQSAMYLGTEGLKNITKDGKNFQCVNLSGHSSGSSGQHGKDFKFAGHSEHTAEVCSPTSTSQMKHKNQISLSPSDCRSTSPIRHGAQTSHASHLSNEWRITDETHSGLRASKVSLVASDDVGSAPKQIEISNPLPSPGKFLGSSIDRKAPKSPITDERPREPDPGPTTRMEKPDQNSSSRSS